MFVLAGLLAIGVVLTALTATRLRPAADTPGEEGRAAATSTSASSAAASGDDTDAPEDEAARDELANRPMMQVAPEHARPMELTARDPGAPIVLPRPQRQGPAGVPTGFPHTPVGAMAQMVSIDQAALQSGSLAGVREVIAAWAAPGGPTEHTWSGVGAMASLLTGAGLSGTGSPSLSIVLTPAMGLIKGTVGGDFVVPCVDFELDVTMTRTVREAVADCERMVWVGDRWVIGPGKEPAPGTSVWPDTDLALDAGYRTLRTEGAGNGGPSHG